jgi:CPA1 family monovalent cation:H+ antiporter
LRFSRFALFAFSSLRIDSRYQHVWGGLRGAVALALALALPKNIPESKEITAVAFAVVASSIFVQGRTIPWLIRRLRLVACD